MPPATGNAFWKEPCCPTESPVAMTKTPSPLGPPLGSNENVGRISSRWAKVYQPGGRRSPPSFLAEGDSAKNGVASSSDSQAATGTNRREVAVIGAPFARGWRDRASFY